MLALEGSGKSDKAGAAEVRRGLFSLNREVLLQWVPGHCELIGNEWADDAANSAWSSASTTSTSLAGRLTFEAAKAIVKREVVDVEITHSRTKAVYCENRSDEPLTRREAVLLAQLRSGHCRSLAAYRNIIDANSPAMCPYCEEEYETLEHWLQECPATRIKSIRCFGGAAPPLSVLVRAVLAYICVYTVLGCTVYICVVCVYICVYIYVGMCVCCCCCCCWERHTGVTRI